MNKGFKEFIERLQRAIAEPIDYPTTTPQEVKTLDWCLFQIQKLAGEKQ